MNWFAAMSALLVFMLVQKAADGWPLHKLRTWAALMCASLLGWASVAAFGGIPVAAFIVIDILAGVAVLARPAGIAQKAIGLCFAVMILHHLGLKIAMLFFGVVDTASYHASINFAGWVQFGILLAWSGWDVGRAILHRLGFGRAVVDNKAAAGTGR